MQLLASPRCGNKDTAPSPGQHSHTRHKRYIIGAKGWRKRRLTYRCSGGTCVMV